MHKNLGNKVNIHQNIVNKVTCAKMCPEKKNIH